MRFEQRLAAWVDIQRQGAGLHDARDLGQCGIDIDQMFEHLIGIDEIEGAVRKGNAEIAGGHHRCVVVVGRGELEQPRIIRLSQRDAVVDIETVGIEAAITQPIHKIAVTAAEVENAGAGFQGKSAARKALNQFVYLIIARRMKSPD